MKNPLNSPMQQLRALKQRRASERAIEPEYRSDDTQPLSSRTSNGRTRSRLVAGLLIGGAFGVAAARAVPALAGGGGGSADPTATAPAASDRGIPSSTKGHGEPDKAEHGPGRCAGPKAPGPHGNLPGRDGGPGLSAGPPAPPAHSGPPAPPKAGKADPDAAVAPDKRDGSATEPGPLPGS